MLRFRYHYFILAILFLFIEIMIGMFVHDTFIRPHFGDFLVVILIYCFLKSFLNIAVLPMAVYVLIFSYAVEVLQYFKIVEVLGVQRSDLARVIIGTFFSWIDMLAYTLGIAFVLIAEFLLKKNKNI